MGHVMVFAAPPVGAQADLDAVKNILQRALESCGSFVGFINQIGYPDGAMRAIARFGDPRGAATAIASYHGKFIEVSLS